MCVLNQTQLLISPALDQFCLENYVLHCIIQISGFLYNVECYKINRYNIDFTLIFS